MSEIVLALDHRRANPRNSEGAFVTLADGRIMFAWSRYYCCGGGKKGAVLQDLRIWRIKLDWLYRR